MAGTMEETLEKNSKYFLEVKNENNESWGDGKDNHSKFVEIMKMNTKKEEKATENTRGLEHFGKDFRHPPPLRKKVSISSQLDPVFHHQVLLLLPLLLHNKQEDHHF